MGGGSVDLFALKRLDPNAKMDGRCRMLQEEQGMIELPIWLRLGMTEREVSKLLGKPTLRYRDTVLFDHEHSEAINNEPFTVSNAVAFVLRRGAVVGIQVSKSTSD